MGTTTPSRAAVELGDVRKRRYAFEDPGLAVEPPIVATLPEDVAEVQTQSDYRLYVRFFDGTAGIVEMKELIFGKRAGVFAKLADPEEFERVGIGFGAVMWANGLDLAPDAMYDEFKRNGVWVLR
jgi:hypothetical protein